MNQIEEENIQGSKKLMKLKVLKCYDKSIECKKQIWYMVGI